MAMLGAQFIERISAKNPSAPRCPASAKSRSDLFLHGEAPLVAKLSKNKFACLNASTATSLSGDGKLSSISSSVEPLASFSNGATDRERGLD
jgi:hypothetical protein